MRKGSSFQNPGYHRHLHAGHLRYPTVMEMTPHVKEALFQAAVEIGTSVMVAAKEITPAVEKYTTNIIPCLDYKSTNMKQSKKTQFVAIDFNDTVFNHLPAVMAKIKKINHALIIYASRQRRRGKHRRQTSTCGAEVIHIVADYRGQELDGSAAKGRRLLKDIIRATTKLVDDGIRDEVTIIASGGIAMAEQVPKAMLCGADLTTVDIPLMVSIGLRIYEEPEKIMICPEGLKEIPSPSSSSGSLT